MNSTQIELIKHYHKNQFRAGKIEYWKHLENVSFIIKNAMEFSREMDSDLDLKEDLICTAWCHDLLEDTSISSEGIEKVFNSRVLVLVSELTNKKSDYDFAQYVQQIESISGEALLIKMADSIDNINGVAYQMFELGYDWTEDFFDKLITALLPAIRNNSNTSYPITRGYLQSQLDLAHKLYLGYRDYLKK